MESNEVFGKVILDSSLRVDDYTTMEDALDNTGWFSVRDEGDNPK